MQKLLKQKFQNTTDRAVLRPFDKPGILTQTGIEKMVKCLATSGYMGNNTKKDLVLTQIIIMLATRVHGPKCRGFEPFNNGRCSSGLDEVMEREPNSGRWEDLQCECLDSKCVGHLTIAKDTQVKEESGKQSTINKPNGRSITTRTTYKAQGSG